MLVLAMEFSKVGREEGPALCRKDGAGPIALQRESYSLKTEQRKRDHRFACTVGGVFTPRASASRTFWPVINSGVVPRNETHRTP